MTDSIPAAPAGSSAAGRRLWSAVMEEYELEQHGLALLVQATRTITTLDKLGAELRRDGVLVDGRPHPAAVESRLQSIALARVLAALRLPAGADGDQQAGARPQRRVGVRGVYAVGAS